VKQSPTTDFSTILGPCLAIFAIALAVNLENENPISLLNLPSLILVLGGTIGATMVAYPFKTFLLLPNIIWQGFKSINSEPHKHIKLMMRLADRIRKDGPLALEDEIKYIDDTFTKNAISLLIDGFPPEQLLHILENDTAMTSQRHYIGIDMLNKMASFSPAMGMIGTVIGLIGVMSNLSDPSQLGPSVAVAFLTTLYGALLSNLVFSPLSNKLNHKSAEESFIRELIIEGILAIQESENPRIVQQKMESFLSPKQRTVQ